jgi:hypothetical protein
MPASEPNNHSKFRCCLQESNARSAGARKSSRALALMLLAVLLAAAATSAEEHRIQLEDLTKIVSVSDPQISTRCRHQMVAKGPDFGPLPY